MGTARDRRRSERQQPRSRMSLVTFSSLVRVVDVGVNDLINYSAEHSAEEASEDPSGRCASQIADSVDMWRPIIAELSRPERSS